MDGKQLFTPEVTSPAARLAVCVVLAVGAVWAIEALCQGRDIPLWEQYGPWLTHNKFQATAILAALLYAASLALWPEEGEKRPRDEGFSPCP